MARKKTAKTTSSRQQARLRQAQQLAAAKRRRTLIQAGVIAGVAVIVIAIIGTAVIIGRQNSKDTTPTGSATVQVNGTDVQLSLEDTAVRLGKTDAPVTLDMFEDYSCPHCQEYEATTGDTIDTLIASGELAVNYHPIQIVTHYGVTAGSSAACIAVSDPSNWVKVHAALFKNHDQTSDGWNYNQFEDFMRQQGVSNNDALSCVATGKYESWITSNTSAAVADGVSGTPTLRLNGEDSDPLTPDQLTAKVHELAASAK